LAQTTNLSNFDFSNFVIFTPVNGWPSNDGRPQEYIGEVPEPGTVLLMASGLLGLAGLAWRRKGARRVPGPGRRNWRYLALISAVALPPWRPAAELPLRPWRPSCLQPTNCVPLWLGCWA